MEVTIGVHDFDLFMDQNSIILEGKDEFILFGCSKGFSGCGKFKSVSNHTLKPDVGRVVEDENRYIEDLILEKKMATPAAVVLTPFASIVNEIVTIGPVSAIISMPKEATTPPIYGNIFISTLVVVNQALDQGILLKLLMEIQETLANVLWDFGLRKGISTKNSPHPILIVCKRLGGGENPDKTPELEDLIRKCVEKASSSLLGDLGYPLSITQILSASGVEIDDLTAAGAELLVRVDDSPEIRSRIKTELEKALGDVNVVSMVLAGIRVDEDYQHHRVRGVDVDDDPAYLYADEVLGMAIANQIAGTKAIFNFKRYDEKKPGIISKLGPMLDDVCAGLVAGCMSKIFEE